MQPQLDATGNRYLADFALSKDNRMSKIVLSIVQRYLLGSQSNDNLYKQKSTKIMTSFKKSV